tara:strand:- start:2343 stop:2978 length:636 start_codon:yes stop_codon:yes gene_type:complete
MSLTIELDSKIYYKMNSDNFISFLKPLKELFLTTKKIRIKSTISDITGSCLDMFFKGLRELPECIELLCDNNNLTFLPNLPKCEGIDCSNNNLELLPDIPSCKNLLCFNNRLKKLPNLPKCIHLSCTNNNIKNINIIPQCEWLECNYNKLESIAFLPKCVDLDCSNNNLSSLSHQQLNICQKILCHNNLILNNNKKFMIFEKHYYTANTIV